MQEPTKSMSKTAQMALVDALMYDGYDFVTALEHANKKLDELRDRGPGTYTVYSVHHEITIKVKGETE